MRRDQCEPNATSLFTIVNKQLRHDRPDEALAAIAQMLDRVPLDTKLATLWIRWLPVISHTLSCVTICSESMP